MVEEIKAHETSTSVVRAPLAEVDAGTTIALRVQVSCPDSCDLRGTIVRIVSRDGPVAKEVELTEFDETVNETGDFGVKAPTKLGEYTWTALFRAQEKDGVLYQESSSSFSFIVKPHSTSIAVWDVPSPVAFNDRFKIKVGVKCSAECRLEGQKVAVYGQRGKKAAMAALGGVPWPGTSALYWAEVELEAPGVEAYYRWRVKFRKPDLELPHEEASYHFAFTTTRPPERVVIVEVSDKDANTPVKNANVLLRPQSGYSYRGYTHEGGVAKLDVPKGAYTLYVSKGDQFETFQTAVEITDDATIKAELLLRVGQWWER